MNDYLISLIRTAVPSAVGAVLSWALVNFGLSVDDDTKIALITGLTGAIITIYYALVRALETKFPWVGSFLGAPKAPAYKGTPGDGVAVVETTVDPQLPDEFDDTDSSNDG